MNRFYLCSPGMDIFSQIASAYGAIKLDIDASTFPEGTPNIKIHLEKILQARGKVCVVYFSDYKDMAEKYREQLIIWVLADTLNITCLTVVDMYDPLATMERVSPQDEGRIATANVDAQWWKTLPRKVNRILFDHHTLQQRFYFTGGNTKIWYESAMQLARQEFDDKEKYSIAFPDDGAAKRFGSMFSDFDQIVCVKKRDGDKRVVEIKEGDPQGRYVVIIDDLVRSGGTLIECAKALDEQGAHMVSVFVTHAAFTDEASVQRLEDCVYIAGVYATDTIPRTYKLFEGRQAFHVLSVRKIVKKRIEQIEAHIE